VAISTGGVIGTGGMSIPTGTGGVLGTGGARPGTGGAASGRATGTSTGGTVALASGGAGGVGGAGGSEPRDLDASPPDAPATGEEAGLDSELVHDGGIGTGGAVGTGGANPIDGGTGGNGSGGSGGSTSLGVRPCDIYAAAATPCVAAYSMVRLLSSTYGGVLYQVRKGSSSSNTGTGGAVQDIRATADGFADAAAQDAFCAGSTCTVSVLYDQSGKGNNLRVAKKGCSTGTAAEDDYESSATARSVTVGGRRVYGLYIKPHEGYRNNSTSAMPTGNVAQAIYEVVDGKRYSAGCCWEFGNATTDNCFGGNGRASALYFGLPGTDASPWFTGDFGGGPWLPDPWVGVPEGGGSPALAINAVYALGILKTSPGNGTIRLANAQSGQLVTGWDGSVGVSTWQLKGGIVLGIGGDNSNASQGTFFEGAIVSGLPSDTTDLAILRNVQAVGYGN
jgi:non-reducing end alpha-L-arabinofuranosidase